MMDEYLFLIIYKHSKPYNFWKYNYMKQTYPKAIFFGIKIYRNLIHREIKNEDKR